mmetsp:Transcript_8108/g.16032  ORF Transcript_8108/g.16032 Transcript_8108/m.16032 type:complete len:88 (-) Transcript_8108:6-269(-)
MLCSCEEAHVELAKCRNAGTIDGDSLIGTFTIMASRLSACAVVVALVESVSPRIISLDAINFIKFTASFQGEESGLIHLRFTLLYTI